MRLAVGSISILMSVFALSACTGSSGASHQSSVAPVITPEEFKNEELNLLNNSIGEKYALTDDELQLVASKTSAEDAASLNEILSGKTEAVAK